MDLNDNKIVNVIDITFTIKNQKSVTHFVQIRKVFIQKNTIL